jgi:hypothetical protein
MVAVCVALSLNGPVAKEGEGGRQRERRAAAAAEEVIGFQTPPLLLLLLLFLHGFCPSASI